MMNERSPASKRPRNSRWSRLPATFRSGEKRAAGAESDQQRLTLYLPAHVLDRAEALAREAGAESLQAYCEQLLRQAIERSGTPQVTSEPDPDRPEIGVDWVDDIASDPDYQVRWPAATPSAIGQAISALEAPDEPLAGSEGKPTSLGTARVDSPTMEPRPTEPRGPTDTPEPEPPTAIDAAAAVVLRHAALAGEFPESLITRLRRGEAFEPEPAGELLQALIDLERAFQGSTALDRYLAFALHRLAFEGQVLLTDAWPDREPDPATVETLRFVQEAVDRVLSGEDIRYHSQDDEPSEGDDTGSGP